MTEMVFAQTMENSPHLPIFFSQLHTHRRRRHRVLCSGFKRQSRPVQRPKTNRRLSRITKINARNVTKHLLVIIIMSMIVLIVACLLK